MATRHLIRRLSERTEALVARLKPPGRTFVMTVRNHPSKVDTDITAYRQEHGVTADDILIAIEIVPYKRRPGETASEARRRELREAETMKRIRAQT
jgi:hypothetical protein